MFDDADKALDEMRRDVARWRFYSARVAALLGVSLEEFEREIDGAISDEGKAAE